MSDILNYIGASGFAIVLLSVFIEITPIKINPIQWLGNCLNKGTREDLKNINKKLDDHIVKSYRNDILQFMDSLLFYPSKLHTREQWNNILDACSKYDDYIKENNLTNGQVEEAMIYIKSMYQDALKSRSFKDVPKKEKKDEQ